MNRKASLRSPLAASWHGCWSGTHKGISSMATGVFSGFLSLGASSGVNSPVGSITPLCRLTLARTRVRWKLNSRTTSQSGCNRRQWMVNGRRGPVCGADLFVLRGFFNLPQFWEFIALSVLASVPALLSGGWRRIWLPWAGALTARSATYTAENPANTALSRMVVVENSAGCSFGSLYAALP